MELNELDEAEMRVEFRQLYKDLGYPACMQVLYEILKSAEILATVMKEERDNEKKMDE